MPLGDLAGTGDKFEKEQQNKSKGSGRSGPDFTSRVPYMAIYEDEDGNLQYSASNEKLAIEYKDGEINAVPEELERYWLSQDSWRRMRWMVEKHLNMDLMDLLKEDPEKALKASQRAAKQHSPKDQPSLTEKCPVCREDIHVINDDYGRVGKRRVCSHHTVKELADADLLEK